MIASPGIVMVRMRLRRRSSKPGEQQQRYPQTTLA